MLVTSTKKKKQILTAACKLLKQDYRYHKLHKSFSKFYHIHLEFIVKIQY